jgi:hypothetical protein
VARDQGKTTRLQGELAHRYTAQAPTTKKKPQPGQGSLTEGLEEVAVEGELDQHAEQEQEQDVEGEGPEILAQPKKSLFELPRKDPIRPSLLGGGVEVDPQPASTAGKPASPSPGKPAPAAPATPGKGPTRRG